jgi:ADP-ribose pyrophosphatase YjhB (NUDIX family)
MKGVICTSVFIVRDGAVLLGLRHYKKSEWREVTVWTTPGGKNDPGESSEDGIRRETAEETDITELRELTLLGRVAGASGRGEVVDIYIATTSQEARVTEPQKFSEWRYHPLDDMPSNFINPPALALVRQRLGK